MFLFPGGVKPRDILTDYHAQLSDMTALKKNEKKKGYSLKSAQMRRGRGRNQSDAIN